MNPFALARHLDSKHGVDWTDVMDTDEMNRTHRDLHDRHLSPVHFHQWAGAVADPQPQMRTDGGQDNGTEG